MKYPRSCWDCMFWDDVNYSCAQKIHPKDCEFVDEWYDEPEEEPEEECEEEAKGSGIIATTNGTDIRFIVDSYLQIQKLRVAIGNRIAAVRRGKDEETLAFLMLQEWHKTLLQMELNCVERARVYLHYHPVWPWLKNIKGVGPMLGARILSVIDIEKADTISALWRFAGLGVVDGKAERVTKGEKRHYCSRLKSSMYLLAVSFLRTKGKFSEIYYREKERQEKLHPELRPIVVHYRALRKMEKMFLACLWRVWREALGLPIRKPYVAEYLNHTHIYDPSYFEEGKKGER